MLKKACMCLMILFAVGLAAATADDIGNHRIPEAVTYAGTAVPAGTYTIQIVEGSEGPYLQLSKGGEVVAKDLAIVIPARGAGKDSIQIANIAGQNFLRIRVRHGDNWYYAYLERSR
jgi:hypothetical protein